MQDPKLAKWWAEAANYRSRGVDRVLVPAPWTRTIEELCADGVRGDVYAHEQFQLPQGTSASFLEAVREEAVEPLAEVRLGARRCVGDRDGERVGVLPAVGDPDVRPVG